MTKHNIEGLVIEMDDAEMILLAKEAGCVGKETLEDIGDGTIVPVEQPITAAEAEEFLEAKRVEVVLNYFQPLIEEVHLKAARKVFAAQEAAVKKNIKDAMEAAVVKPGGD